MYRYVYIPVELCFFAFRNRFVRPLQLYVYLKANCDGFVKLGVTEQETIAEAIGLKSDRAVRQNLQKLIKRNWIGYDKRSGRYIIRGYERVLQQEHCTSRTRAEFPLRNICQFKPFAAGAVICYLINQQKKKRWLEARNKGRALPSGHLFFPVAVTALAKILKVSIRTAFIIRQLAIKHKHVVMKPNWQKTKVKAKELKNYRAACPEIAGKLKIQQNYVCERMPDSFQPCIRLRKKRLKEKK